jgi:uncharacterized membrane protein
MRQLLFAVAIAGLLVSGYLFITYTSGGPITCGLGHGCDTVRASEYASFFGVPTPVYGLVFYLLLAIGVIIRWQRGLLLLTTGGLVVSAYLTYLEAFVVEAWCTWCVASAVITIAAFVLTLYSSEHGNN